MKNLENKEILSDEILKSVQIIISHIPNAVFGGSIALNAVGLLNRKISDIDLFFPLNQSLSDNEFLSIITNGITSDTVTNTNGVEIQRTASKINDTKVCCFKVSDEELQCSNHTFERDGKSYTIKIQNVNYAIEAKMAYAKHKENNGLSKENNKHFKDLDDISNVIEDLFNDDLPF